MTTSRSSLRDLGCLAVTALATLLPAQTKGTRTGKPAVINRILAVVDGQIITQHDVSRELGTRHITDPALRGKPEMIRRERFTILRRLTSRILLEQAFYSLDKEPAMLDANLNFLVSAEIGRLRKRLGSTKAFNDHLRDRGQSLEDLKRATRSNLKWNLFLNESVEKLYSGSKRLLKVRPKEMLALYHSKAWKARRDLPAHVHFRILAIPITDQLPSPRAAALAKKVAADLRSQGAKAKLPPQVEPKSLVLIDCPGSERFEAAHALRLGTGPGSPPVLSRGDFSPAISAFCLGSESTISPPITATGSVMVVQVTKRHPARTIPFTDPKTQEQIRTHIITVKLGFAKRELSRKLWNRASIWPPELKKSGSPTGSPRTGP